MKFAVAALVATAQAGWKGDGAVVGTVGSVRPALIDGGVGSALTLGAGLDGQVLINSGVDNNAVDAPRFAQAIQGSRLLQGDVAGYLAAKNLAATLPLSASVVGTYGDRIPVATSAYVDTVEQQEFTVDASTTKTITDKKVRQQPRYITETRTDTKYTPELVTKQRDTLVTEVEARPEQIDSTRYDTVQVNGVQDRARYDVVSDDQELELLELEQGTKEVTKKDFTVEYDEVTKTRDNFITINKLCDVEYEEEVQETILVNVPAVCQQTVNRPLAEQVFVDKLAVGVSKVGYATGARKVGYQAVGAGCLSSSCGYTSDGISDSDCGSWCDSSSDDGILGGVGLGLGGYYQGLAARPVYARTARPVYAKRAYGVTVPKTVLRDNFVTVDVACTKQEEQVVTKTVTKTRKEPCTETINYQTTVTQDIPRTNVFDVTDTVDVTRQGSRTETLERDVAQRRIEDAPTTSIEAVRTDSSRIRDKLVPTQRVEQVDYQDVTYVPEDVTVERQNLRYDTVEKEVSYDASIEGTAVKIQEVPRQKRILQLQSDLGPIGADIAVANRGHNGDILIGADATAAAAGALTRPIVASDGVLSGSTLLNGGLGDGVVVGAGALGGRVVGTRLGGVVGTGLGEVVGAGYKW